MNSKTKTIFFSHFSLSVKIGEIYFSLCPGKLASFVEQLEDGFVIVVSVFLTPVWRHSKMVSMDFELRVLDLRLSFETYLLCSIE